MKKIVIIGMVVLLVAALFIDDRLVDDLSYHRHIYYDF